jgi:hypothetical protein
MTVLVSDTSVLIDLERGGLLDFCFQLPFVFAVPDLLYRRELVQMDGAQLVARGLRVEELTGEELSVAQNIRDEHKKLSLPDAYAYPEFATPQNKPFNISALRHFKNPCVTTLASI